MPVVLVIIILAAWAVILGPSLVKRRARTGGDQSITHFHHQLRVLEQRAPDPIVTPAYRLRAVDGTGSPTGVHSSDSGGPPVLAVVGAKELPRPALAFLGEPEVVAAPAAPLADPGTAYYDEAPRRSAPPVDDHDHDDTRVSVDHAPRTVDPFTRAQARRRRRDTLAVLGAVLVVTVLAGIVTGSSAAWAMAALVGMAFGAYVALLVHLRRMAAEREMKLRYLDVSSGQVARSGGLPTHVSGRYAHPSSQRAVAR